MNKLDTFISFTDRAYALLTLPNGNIASRPINHKQFGPSQEITAITNLINNNLLCTGNLSGEICLWSISSGAIIRKLAGHVTRVNAITGLPNGYLASAGHEFSIKLWNVTAEYPLVETLRGHTGFVYSLSVLSNGYLASSDTDNNVMIWDSNNGALVKAITSHSPLVDSLAILFANNFVSTEKCLKNLKIWSPNGQELTQIETNNASNEIGCVCVVSMDYLATSDLEENLIKVWHIRTGALVQILNGHKSCVTALFELPNGNLISGSSDSQIKIWQPLSGQLIKTLNE